MKPLRSKAIRNAAKGEMCTLQFPGLCNFDPETTVFAHYPDEVHGIGQKGSDLNGGFACSACHDIIDRRNRAYEAFTEAQLEKAMRRSMKRTLEGLVELGVIEIKGLKW